LHGFSGPLGLKWRLWRHNGEGWCDVDPNELVFRGSRSRPRSLYVVVRPSVVCRRVSSVFNVHAPYSARWNFRQFFYPIWYSGHPL